jgi:hypothetical protein
LFAQQPNVRSQRCFNVTFVCIGARFDFTFGEFSHALRQRALLGIEERSCGDEAIHC